MLSVGLTSLIIELDLVVRVQAGPVPEDSGGPATDPDLAPLLLDEANNPLGDQGPSVGDRWLGFVGIGVDETDLRLVDRPAILTGDSVEFVLNEGERRTGIGEVVLDGDQRDFREVEVPPGMKFVALKNQFFAIDKVNDELAGITVGRHDDKLAALNPGDQDSDWRELVIVGQL